MQFSEAEDSGCMVEVFLHVPNFIYDTNKDYCSADYVANISAFRRADIVNCDKGVPRPVSKYFSRRRLLLLRVLLVHGTV